MTAINFALCLLVALVFSKVGSHAINLLYAMPEAPLSFPESIVERSRFRVAILFFSTLGLALFFVSSPLPKGLYFFLASFFLILITVTDFEQHVIFDRMNLPFALLGVVAVLHLGLPLQTHIAAALIGGGIFFIIAVITGGGIGGGDIKLITVLGIWLGEKLLDVVLSGCILGGVAALIMLITKIKNRTSYFAYGPYFALSAIYIFISALE